MHREDVIFATTGGDLFVDDGVKLLEGTGFASVSSVDAGKVNRIGVAGEVQNIWSAGDVTLANRAVVHGILQTTGSVSQQQDSVVNGAIITPAILDPLQTVTWNVTFPSSTLGSASLEPDQVRALAPGSYSDASIKSRAHLKLSPGVYTFESLSAEPDAVFEIDNSAPVLIYARTGFTFRGKIQRSQSAANVLFGTAATSAVSIESPFTGILVAPWAAVSLATTSVGHSVSVFAKSITAHQNTNVTHQPFDTRTFCGLGSFAPGCPTHCINHIQDATETEVDCGGECPGCDPGHVCSVDSDCGAGLICGNANGACFGLARATRLCWKRACESDVQAGGCGQPNSACGSNCACVTKCDGSDPTATCPTGEVCKKHMGGLVNAPFPDACFDPQCPSNTPALCGNIRSICGTRCVCTPDCSHASSTDPSDGCGGTCPGACKAGESGCCTDDVNCPAGYTCVQSDDGVSTCLSTKDCVYKPLAPPLCGTANAICGPRCPVCAPRCDGRTCGPDPNCGQSCGSCSAGSFCGIDGQCITPAPRRTITIPDDKGNQRPLSDLPVPVTSPVGAIKGQFSVSEQGTAQYVIPIEVPPGRAGMQPALTLQYSGTRANEELGVGWHLEGLSQITRCPRVQALDKFSSPIQNDPSDHFCIDGKRLENVKGVSTGTVGSYGANGTEYRTLIDSFSRVVSFQDSGSGIQPDHSVAVTPVPRAQQGPDSFRVWTKDGRILTFGLTQDSLVMARNGIRYAWMLNRVEDHFGNTMDVAYTNLTIPVPKALADRFPNVLRPKLISYTGHTGSSPEETGKRQVEFTYEERSDQQLRIRQGGVAFFAQQRLSSITTSVHGVAVKNYRLKYYTDRPFSQVENIFECTGGTDAVCKPPTNFKYKEETGFELGAEQTDFAAAAQLDVNGDGIPDYLTTTVTSSQTGVSDTLKGAEVGTDIAIGVGGMFLGGVGGLALNTAWGIIKDDFWSLFADEPTFSVARTMQLGQIDRQRSWTSISGVTGVPCDTSSPAYVLDYDRDGKDDLVAACGANNQDLFVSLSLGNGNFATPTQVVHLPIGKIRRPDPYYSDLRDYDRLEDPVSPILFDINGDSLQDLVSCKDQFTLEVRLRLGPKQQGFGLPIQLATQTTNSFDSRKNQILCGQGRPTYHTFDIDGDGTPDLLVHADNGWQALRYSVSSTGEKIEFRPIQFSDVGGSGDGGGFPALGDFNGDGLVDVWTGGRDTSNKAVIWLNTGDGRFSAHHVTRPLPALQQSEPFSFGGTAIADFNADGRADFIETWNHPFLDALGQNINFFNTALVPDSLLTTLDQHDPLLIWPVTTQLGTHDAPGSFRTAGDIDGDGIVDLFGYGKGTFFGKGAHNMLLSRVVDGVGNLVTIDYDRQEQFSRTYNTDDSCKGDTWPEKCLKRMTGLVAAHAEGFADGSREVIERNYFYSYLNARMNLTGHGWLGFDQRTVSRSGHELEHDGGQAVITDYEPVARYTPAGVKTDSAAPPYLYPLAGLPKIVTVQRFIPFGDSPPLQTDRFSRRSRTQSHWTVQQSTSGRPFPFSDFRETTNYDEPFQVTLGTTTSAVPSNAIILTDCTTGYTPDGYGNIKIERGSCQPVFDIYAEATTKNRTFQIDASQWLVSNPTSIQVTSVRPFASSQTQNWEFTYQNGMVLTVARATDSDEASDLYQKTTYDRDSFGNVKTITKQVRTGEPARVTTVTYDSDNVFPETTTNALGQESQLSFDASWGLPATVTDPNGIPTQQTYDGFGRIVETKGPEGNSIVSYSNSTIRSLDTTVGHMEPRIDVTTELQGVQGTRSGSTVNQFDGYGRLVRARAEGLGGTPLIQDLAYDELGRTLGSTVPHTTEASSVPSLQYTYDYLDRVTRVEHSDQQHTFRTYQYATTPTLSSQFQHWLDGMGCGDLPITPYCAVGVTLSTDEVGHQNVAISDHRGLILRTIDGDNVVNTQHTSNYKYGPFNRLVEAKDNLGFVTSFAFDAYGRRVAFTDPDSGKTASTYNGYDDLKTTVDPKNQTRSFFYDDLGRLTSIIDADSSSRWFYDQGVNAIGRLSESISPATAENPDGQHVRYAYEPPNPNNNRGLVQKVEYSLDGISYPITFDHDDLARTDRIHYPQMGSGPPIVAQYIYDTSGVLTAVEEVGSSATRPLWHLNEAYQAQLIQRETFGNGASTSYSYNADRRWLESIQTTLGSDSIQSLEYTHYDNGLIHNRTDSGAQREYRYDNLGRLSYAIDLTGSTNISVPYTYDAIGNLTGRGETVISYRGSTEPHHVQLAGDSSYFYDANGNLQDRSGNDTPRGSQFIDYTPFNLPRSIRIGDGSTGVQVTKLEYSADQERVVRRDDDTTRYFVGQLYQRVTSNATKDTTEERFRVYAGSRQLAEIVRAGDNDDTLFFHSDSAGSVDTISRSDQTFVTQKFDVFGKPVDPPNLSVTRAGFTGHQHDDDLGFIDMKGRVYDPLAGQFTTSDPVMRMPYWSQGLNRYSYAYNDPVNNTDPSGFDVDVGGGIAGGMVGAGHVASVGIIAYGFGAGFGAVTGPAGLAFNIGETLLNPSFGGSGGTVSRTVNASAPSAAPAATGGGQGAMNATGQVAGRPGPSAPIQVSPWGVWSQWPDLRLAENDGGPPEGIPDAGLPGGVPEPGADTATTDVPGRKTGPGSPYVVDPSRKPPGWTDDWVDGFDRRGPYSEDPETGTKWYPHHADPDHWDHYENDQGVDFPRKNVKPWPNQKRPPYGHQSATDPWLVPTVGGAGMLMMLMMLLLAA